MGGREREKRYDELFSGLLGVINQMRGISDGLYKHIYDLDTPLPQINKGLVHSIEKVLQATEKEYLVSEKVARFVNESTPDVSRIVEYLAGEEKRKKELKCVSKGKARYFSMFYQGVQRATDDPQ
ncbi:hypothetical protein NEDG_01376 [Nematocida displodere]|uniref:Uncharacterized protein n=1 Tax=Nematocida displodere TaxID=1805483 RepID=A0A177EBH4_9MICR|nr:hypothetical protein NEDG_01376 [Nematocida displodere]